MTKRAFTLVELLVVVGIMAALATMSVGSYFAVVRGMADRGAVAAATSVISLAQERARIDLVPTVVYFYNEVVQRKDESKGTDLVVAGVAVAVRRAGRLTRVNSSLLNDEFADLDRTYGVVDKNDADNSDTFRLYKFDFSGMKFSSVSSEAVEDPVDNEKYLIEHPVNRNFKKANGDNENENEIISYAFKRRSGYSSWKVGDAYGYEFARVRLPDNYIFENVLPSNTDPIKEVSKVIKCYPDSDREQLETVHVYNKRPSGWKSIGNTKDEMKDI